jgi:hypothetical protein
MDEAGPERVECAVRVSSPPRPFPLKGAVTLLTTTKPSAMNPKQPTDNAGSPSARVLDSRSPSLQFSLSSNRRLSFQGVRLPGL